MVTDIAHVSSRGAGNLQCKAHMPPISAATPVIIIERFFRNIVFHAVALGAATYEELNEMYAMTAKINEVLKGLFLKMNIKLVDFKIEFGKTLDGEIVLADEVSPDTCRLWDATTNEKLDKDRFRRDLGKVREAYEEILARLKKITA